MPRRSSSATARTPAAGRRLPVSSSADPSASRARDQCVNETIRTPSRWNTENSSTFAPIPGVPSSATSSAIFPSASAASISAPLLHSATSGVCAASRSSASSCSKRRPQRRLGDLRRDVDGEDLHVDAARSRLGHPALAPVALGALFAELAVSQQQQNGQIVVCIHDDRVSDGTRVDSRRSTLSAT